MKSMKSKTAFRFGEMRRFPPSTIILHKGMHEVVSGVVSSANATATPLSPR